MIVRKCADAVSRADWHTLCRRQPQARNCAHGNARFERRDPVREGALLEPLRALFRNTQIGEFAVFTLIERPCTQQVLPLRAAPSAFAARHGTATRSVSG